MNIKTVGEYARAVPAPVWFILGVGIVGAWIGRSAIKSATDAVAHAVDIVVQIPANVAAAVLPNPSINGPTPITQNPDGVDPLAILSEGP